MNKSLILEILICILLSCLPNYTIAGNWLVAEYDSTEMNTKHSENIENKTPLQIDTSIFADKGQVLVEVDLSEVSPMTQHSTLDIKVLPADKSTTVLSRSIWSGLKQTRIALNMIGQPDGKYKVVLAAKNPNGLIVGKWSGDFLWKKSLSEFANTPKMKVLNNFTFELLNLTKSSNKITPRQVEFVNPHDGWVFFSNTAKISGKDSMKILLDNTTSDDAIISQNAKSGYIAEGMRYLPKGKHILKIECIGHPIMVNLIVRAIPELIYSDYPEGPHITQYGPYDWLYLNKHILKNINTMIVAEAFNSSPFTTYDTTEAFKPYLSEFKKQGKKLVFHASLGTGTETDAANAPEEFANEVYQRWWNNLGFQSNFGDGIIIDEFAGGSSDVRYISWTQAIERLYKNPKADKKKIYAYAYGTSMTEGTTSKIFFDTLIKHNGILAVEIYPTNDLAEDTPGDSMQWYRNMRFGELYEKHLSGANRHLMACFSNFTMPPLTVNVEPGTDYKVLMDTMMNWAANDGTLFDMYGFTWWKNTYADEEIVRWTSALFRHYCIEGKTNLLSNKYGFEYKLNHIRNGDFNDGLDGWTINSAQSESMSVKKMEGYGYLQGRYIGTTDPRGSSFIWMKRSEKGPNTFSQEIKGLTPGKLYSVKMFTSDYQNIQNGISKDEKFAISLKVQNSELVTEKCLQQIIRCRGSAAVAFGKFSSSQRPVINVSEIVFRTKTNSAMLSISDWANKDEPGGPIGQEIICNFIQVQPYFQN